MKLTSILLILVLLSGCVARYASPWDRVKALSPGTRVEVQLQEEAQTTRSGRVKILGRRVKGYFQSASEDYVVISEKPLTKQRPRSVYEVVRREEIWKMRAHRPLEKRYPGWFVLSVGLAVGVNFFRAEADFRPGYQVLYGLAIPIGISIPFFLGSKMGGIYKAPRHHQENKPKVK